MTMSNIERDGDGFLADMNTWSEDVMFEMAKIDGVELTDQRLVYIAKAREMYAETGVVPPVRVFAKAFGMDRKAKDLYDTFESGPMKQIAKYAGLPKPRGCV
jgi:TusE/DsrC/DsvC family sulfur relay protein